MHTTRFVGYATNRTKMKLETTFSLPSQEKPVPVAVARVHFTLIKKNLKLSYNFECDNVHHGGDIGTLAPGKFEMWLDRIIRDKLEVRKLHSLTTPFEETRLAPPPAYDESDEEEEDEEVKADEEAEHGAGWLQLESNSLTEGLQVSELLSNIFDAADEECEGLLSHREVADLLYATPLGLTDWDIKLLLTTAHENDEGLIEYKPFVQAAPEIIEALLKRRAAFIARNQPNATVTYEAVELCFADELEEIGRTLREQFNLQDPNQTNLLSRSVFRSCLLSKPERFSLQEVQMLMQMVKENESSQVPYDDFVFLLQQLRIDAFHNALVETDVASLRVHLILLLRREGLSPSMQLPIWTLRRVLLSADQLCLSRIQVHILLCIIKPNEYGWVDVNYFLRICCTVIPHMFDAAKFMEKAAFVAKEKADAQAREELEELQGLTGGSMGKVKKGDDGAEEPEDDRANAPDREAVEKMLIQELTKHDLSIEKRTSHHTLEVQQFLAAMRHETLQQCQLSDAEVRGFIAEAPIDENNEINFTEHVRTWVPILFEVRKSRVHDSIVSKDWDADGSLIDISRLEEAFPTLPRGQLPSGTPNDTQSPEKPKTSRTSINEPGPSDGLEKVGTKESGEHSASFSRKASKVISVNRASQRFMHRKSNTTNESDGAAQPSGAQRSSIQASRQRGSVKASEEHSGAAA